MLTIKWANHSAKQIAAASVKAREVTCEQITIAFTFISNNNAVRCDWKGKTILEI